MSRQPSQTCAPHYAMRQQSPRTARLNHLLNGEKLTSITFNMRCLVAARGFGLLGLQRLNVTASPQSLNKHPLQDGPGSVPHVALRFGKSLQPRTLLYVTSSATKLRWNWSRCRGSARGERTPSGKVTFRQILSIARNIKWRMSGRS